GAVITFDLDACPSGWSALPSAQGRTVVGVNPDTTNGLSVRARGQSFGEETHTLIASKVPSHTHDFTIYGGTNPNFTNGTTGLIAQGGLGQASTFGTSKATSAAGNGQPHNNMQPSIVLLYCRKQ